MRHPFLGHPPKRVALAKAFALRIAIFLSELPTLLSFSLSFSPFFLNFFFRGEMLMVTVDGHGSGYREISVTADDIFFFKRACNVARPFSVHR